MKRALKIVAGVVVVLVALVAAAVVPAFIGRQAITDGFETAGVRIVKDGIVSVAVVQTGPREVALVDAGNDPSGKAILAELSRRQLGPDNVSAVFLTHGHADHIGAATLFPKAQVMALEAEVGLIEGREGAHGPATRLMPVHPTGIRVARPLHDGESVVVGDTTVRVFAVPGHTAGSAAYLVRGVLFLGDAADTTDGGDVKGAPWIFSDSQAEDRASLARLDARLRQEGVTVAAMAFAHSGVRTDGLAPLTRFAETTH